jgi:hypothetical protein
VPSAGPRFADGASGSKNSSKGGLTGGVPARIMPSRKHLRAIARALAFDSKILHTFIKKHSPKAKGQTFSMAGQ